MDGNIKSTLDDENVVTGSNNIAEAPRSANVSSDEDESFRTCNNAETGTVINGPPEFNDDSDASDSENNSALFLSDNNDYDTDISDPGREGVAEEDERNVETSFQRELLDYLGSLFNVSSRIRTRDNVQSVTVNDEQLAEYKKLREKVDKEMKILGVGTMVAELSTDQSIARNLYYLLSARERGDWSSCRQYMRVIPMWTFERDEVISKNGSSEDGSSEAWSSDASVGSVRMEGVQECPKMNRDGGVENGIIMVDEDDETVFDCKGIAAAKNSPDIGYLNRGSELWAENIDNEEVLQTTVNAPVVIAASVDTIKDVEEESKSECAVQEHLGSPSKVVSECNRCDKRDSSIFKRSFQNYNSDEPDGDINTRNSSKMERDTSLNISKKCKLDTNDESIEVTKSPILSQVSRIGQRDIKTAIYGSRWSVQRLGLETRFPVHEGCVNALNFSSTGDWIASGSDDREVVITDWQRSEQVSRFSVGHSSNIFQVRFLPGSNDLELVTCSRDRSVRYAALSSTGQFQYSRLLAKHNDACHKMDMPLDQPCLVISAGEDCRVLWSDVRGPKNSGLLCLVDKVPLYSISCNPVRSQEFCVAGKDTRVYIYDRRKPKKALSKLCPDELADKTRSNYHVTSVVYSGDGNSVLASYNDEDIYLMSVSAHTHTQHSTFTSSTAVPPSVTQHKYVGHRNVQTVTGVSFYGPNQEYIVSGSNDGHVLLWERDTESLINWFLADEAGVVNVLQPHPFQPVLATSGLDHDIKLWSMWAADRGSPRVITVDDDLIDRDQESSRIDLAWRTLSRNTTDSLKKDDRHNDEVDYSVDHEVLPNDQIKLPFNLRNLQVITALNWKMRSESYPYSFDNTLENLIFMSRRQGENQLRNLFISDSDSNESYETVPNIADDTGTSVAATTVAGWSATNGTTEADDGTAATRNGSDANRGPDADSERAADRGTRPDGCRSS